MKILQPVNNKIMRISVATPLVFCIAILFLFSCKKTDTIQSPGGTTATIKTYIEQVVSPGYNTADTFNVSYDASNRVISLISIHPSGGKFIYQYNSNSTYNLDIINGTHLSIRLTAFINNNSLLDSTFQYNDTNDSTTQKFIYNAAKQVVQFKTYNYKLTTGAVLFRKNDYTYDNNGNEITDTETSATGNINTVITYTYTNLTGNLFVLGTIYQPAMYKNLQSTISYYTPYNNTTQTFTCTYTFDSNNRVTSQQQTDGKGTTVTKKFIYN